jgi:type II secretory pathway pseudopilin PulG
VDCCDRLELKTRPTAFILNGNGGLNAFATKFLGHQYVVLLSDVVDAMALHPDGVRFYMGHELGHLRRKHLNGALLRWPVLWLPLLGAAYSRARESTCDRHGLACCDTPEGAVRALAALSAGNERWKQLDIAAYLDQAKHASGFWMSFHELCAGYPWLTKRAARVMKLDALSPKRHPLSYVLAVFVPYAGRLGGGFGLLILVYIIGVLAAVALPAYQDYTVKAKFSQALVQSQGARDALSAYYQTNQKVPESLQAAGVQASLPNATHLSMNPTNMVLTVEIPQGALVFTPTTDEQDKVIWKCEGGEGSKPAQLPPICH